MQTLPKELFLIVLQSLDASSKFSMVCVSKFYTSHNKYLMSDERKIDSVCVDAIHNNYVSIFKWLVSDKCQMPKMSAPFRWGRSNSIKVYCKCCISEHDKYRYCEIAAEFNRHDILKYILEGTKNNVPSVKYIVDIMTACAKGNSLEIAKWFYLRYGTNCMTDKASVNTAIINGHFDFVKWLRNNGCPWDSDACTYAAQNGRLEILQYLCEKWCPWSITDCFYQAIVNGHLDVVRWIHERGEIPEMYLNTRACHCAAFYGRLDVLIYLHEVGYPLNMYTCWNAVLGNHLNVVKYLHENGFPLMADACRIATEDNNQDILKYLHDNGCPCSCNK